MVTVAAFPSVAPGINTDGCQINSSTVYVTDRLYGLWHTDVDVFPSHCCGMDFHCLLLIRSRVLIFQHRTHANWQQAHAYKCNQEEWACVQAFICLSSVSGFPGFCDVCFCLRFPLSGEGIKAYKWHLTSSHFQMKMSTLQIPFCLG